MEVKIERVSTFNVTIGGVTYKGFELEDEWEGMLKFKGPDGTLIVGKAHSTENEMNRFSSFFDALINDPDPFPGRDGVSRHLVIKLSPSLAEGSGDKNSQEKEGDDGN